MRVSVLLLISISAELVLLNIVTTLTFNSMLTSRKRAYSTESPIKLEHT